MLRLLHISDLHFGPHYLPVTGEALLRAAAELQPDLIVASGDFTQRAKPHQFAEARAWLDRLPRAPLVVTPGNHDIPLYRVQERLFSPYALYRQYISPDLETVLEVEGAVVAAINTTDPWRRIVAGRLRQSQLDFCAAAFERAPIGAARIVVAHHQFAPPHDFRREETALRGAAGTLCKSLSEIGVELILGGHLHRGYIGDSRDVYAAGSEAGIVIVQSGTSASQRGRAREREKNSFNLIEIDAETIQVTQRLFFSEWGGFRPTSRHVYPRRGRDFLQEPIA